jgi:hypothetical protein
MSFTRMLYKHKDNVVGQLASGIAPASLFIPLQSGQGALFPTTYSGTATSVGTATVLNATGIQAAGVVAGQIIHNITDGSYAVVLSVTTNQAVTTNLKGGSANTWANTNKWTVNPFVVTLIAYDTDGVTILKREKILIDSRSGDNLTVNASGRGFDGSTAQSFSTNDYIYLMWTSAAIDGVLESLSRIIQDIETLPTADEKAALVGSSGPSTVENPFINLDDVSAYGVGLAQTTENSDYAVGEADATTKKNKIVQTFRAQNSQIIAVHLYKAANTGTNAGNVIIEFFAVDGSGNPTGAAISTTTVTAATWNGYSTGQNYISISGAPTFTIGTQYAMVVRQSTSDNANHINLRVATANVYANGTLKRFNTTDGWVAETGDLTFQLLFSVSGKIVRRAGLQIPTSLTPVLSTDCASKGYVDSSITSAITTFPIPQQLIGIDNVVTTASTNTRMASNAAGDIIAVLQRISGTYYISRYAVDNKIWYRTHLVTLSWNGSINNTITILGSYVYVYGVDTSGPTVKVARLNLADLTSETNMTISGGTPSSSDTARNIHNDGTFLYLSDPAVTGRSKKYSVSGTTITFSSNIDYTGMGWDEGIYNDGTYLYQVRNLSSVLNIVKWTMATGGAALSTTTRAFNSHLTSELGAGVIPYSATAFWVALSGTVDALKFLQINLITKP